MPELHLTLDVAGFPEEIVIDDAEVDRLHAPILAKLARPAAGRRVVAFVAGVPGSGKTTLAALWTELARRAHAVPCVALPMDGFHLPNAVLDREQIVRDGVTMPLRRIKGAPETYAVAAMAQMLERLVRGEDLVWPVYDRTLHEPVTEGVRVQGASAVCLLEGNYLLLDRAPWGELARVADARFFLDAAEDEVKPALLARHLRGGRTHEDALAHFARTDAPNIALVRGTRRYADVVLAHSGTGTGFVVREARGAWREILA